MHKSKGQWIVLSSSILASVVALNLAAPAAFAQETAVETDAPSISGVVDVAADAAEIAPAVSEAEIINASDVTELVDSIVEDVLAQEEIAAEETAETVVEDEDEEAVEANVPAESEEVLDVEPVAEAELVAPIMMRMSAPATTDTAYKIQYGDTLWKIANRNGVTVAQLKSWNNLTSDFIHTGNNLVVGRTAAPTTPAPTNPIPTTPTPTPETVPAKTHTVKSGEYLHLIATRYDITVDQLVRWNNLTSNYIYTGNHLIVTNPADAKPVTPAPETPKPETPAPAPQKTHTVKSGDSLWSIANKHGVTINQLKTWNKLSSNWIYSGTVFAVTDPAKTTPTKPAPEKPAPKPETPEKPAPTPETPKPETPAPNPAPTYTVKPGDSLWQIANSHGVTIAQLKDWNKLSSNWIYTGNVFVVTDPAKAPKPEPKPEAPKPEAPKPETPKPEAPKPETPAPKPAPSYTVKPGDSLWQIANSHGVTIAQLKDWNKLSSNWIYTGNVFVVADPAKAPKPEAPKPAPTPDPTPVKPPVVEDKDKVEGKMDVKVNGLKQQFYVGTNLTSAKLVDAKTYFGQKFNVLNEVKANGKTYYEVAQNGSVIGFVEAAAVVEVPVGKTVVYLDAGHGGAEYGANSNGAREKDLNLNISLQVAQRLRDQGYVVHESRTTDEEIRLHDRTDEPNSLMPDIYVSIHHNAMPASYGGRVRGIVSLYHDRSIDEKGYPTLEHDNAQRIADSRRLAQLLNDGMVKETGTPYDMGIRAQNLHVTRTNYVPAALVELGFMDNWTELQNLKNNSYQQKLIGGLVKGINQYFGRK